MVVLLLGLGGTLALKRELTVNVGGRRCRGRRRRCRVTKGRKGRAVAGRCRGRACIVGGTGPVDVLGDVEGGVGGLVGCGGRVVLLGGMIPKIEALERGKTKVVVWHVGTRMRI